MGNFDAIFPESSQQLCDFDFDSRECDWESYALYIVWGFLFPGIAVGFGIMCVGFCFVTCYACFRHIKGSAQKLNVLNYTTPETCGGTFPPLSNGWICRGLLAVLVLISLLLFIAALGVSADVRKHTKDFRDKTDNLIDTVADIVQAAIDYMEDSYLSKLFPKLMEQLKSAADSILDAYDQYKHIVDILDDVLITAFVLETVLSAWLVLLAGLGCCGAISGWRPILLCFIYFALITVFLMSVFFSYCIASEAVYGDFCNAIYDVLDKANGPIEDGFLPCDDFDNIRARNAIDAVISAAQNYTCSDVKSSICSLVGANCGSLNCAFQFSGAIPSEIYVEDSLPCGNANCPRGIPCDPTTDLCYDNNVTVSVCGAECLNTTLRGLARQTISLTSTSQDIADRIYNDLIPILDCGRIRDYVYDIVDDMCVDMMRIGIVGLLSLLATAILVVAIGMALLAHNAVWVHKRLKTEIIRDKARNLNTNK